MEAKQARKDDSGKPFVFLLLAVVGLIAAYFLGMTISRSRIDDFCNAITPKTKMSELPKLAEDAHVSWFYVLDHDGPEGKSLFAAARDKWSMGSYGCRVSGRASTQEVIRKSLGAN